MRVDHCLLALPGTALEEVEEVVSHPQAIAQSEEFLSTLGARVRAEYNTAGAAKLIAEQRLEGVAAIASRRAGGALRPGRPRGADPDVSGQLHALRRAVPRPRPLAAPTSRSLVFGTGHAAGSLHRCLGAFAERHISLSKLESRPRPGRPWEYLFYADLDAAADAPQMVEALAELSSHATFTRLLGSYAAAVTRP